MSLVHISVGFIPGGGTAGSQDHRMIFKVVVSISLYSEHIYPLVEAVSKTTLWSSPLGEITGREIRKTSISLLFSPGQFQLALEFKEQNKLFFPERSLTNKLDFAKTILHVSIKSQRFLVLESTLSDINNGPNNILLIRVGWQIFLPSFYF